MRTLVLVGAVLSVTLGAHVLAHADEERVEAQAHLDRGKRLYGEGDFVGAAVEFEQAERLLAPLARAPDGAVADADADERRRRALGFAAMAWKQADLPVEAFDAYGRLRNDYAAALAPAELAELDAAIEHERARIGSVSVTGVPAGATTRLDSRVPAAELGQRPVRVGAGQHVLEVSLAGHEPFHKQFSVVPAQTVEIAVVLRPSAARARVRIEASVDDAQVKLDGKDVGSAPVDVQASPGVHRYEVAAATYATQAGELDLRAGETAVVRVGMAPERSPIGLRLEPYVGFHVVNLSDSPLGELSVATGLRVFHRQLSVFGMAFGLELEAQTRELNRYAFGPVLTWCPEWLAWSGRNLARRRTMSARVCPGNLAVLATTGGDVGLFSSGDVSVRGSTAIEVDFGVLFVRFAGGLALEQYQRNESANLTGGVTFGEVSVGMNL